MCDCVHVRVGTCACLVVLYLCVVGDDLVGGGQRSDVFEIGCEMNIEGKEEIQWSIISHVDYPYIDFMKSSGDD